MSAPHVVSSRRRHGVGLAVVTTTAALLLAGCGERFGPGSAGPADDQPPAVAEAPPLKPPASTTPTTPAPSTPAPTTPAATPELGEQTNVGGVIWQPKAIYDGPVQLSVRDGYVAVIVPSGTIGELRVASKGEAPVAAPGAGPVPSWGRPHVGTDVSGRTVVTYPRCTDPEQVGTCDIYQWTAATQREVVLKGVSGGALAETEAVMDFGNTLVVREKRPALPADDLRFNTPSLTTLLLKPRGKPIVVVTRHGGRQIDLRGSRIADVYTVRAPSDEDCGASAARALNLKGLTVASRRVECGTNSSQISGPSVADNHLRFGVVVDGEPGLALDHDLATGKTTAARLTQPVAWWSPDGQQSGYALDSVDGEGACTPSREETRGSAYCRIVRSAKLSWKPVDVKWTVKAGDTPVRD